MHFFPIKNLMVTVFSSQVYEIIGSKSEHLCALMTWQPYKVEIGLSNNFHDAASPASAGAFT